MEAFENWYEGMDPFMRVYWTIAIATSVVFAIQMVLTILGIGDTDADASGADMDMGDVSSDGDTLDTGGAVQLFTVRNMINFLLGLGWGGVCFSGLVANRALLVVVSLLCGAAFVSMFLWMLRRLLRLESNGAYRITDCVNQTCSVYLRIPANRQGMGKVQASFGGSVQELDAMCAGDAIPTGAKVVVVEVIDNHTVLVKPC
ncbi:MAG: hypothetical protein ACI4AJ_07415 [Bacteroidaceae bacterium]